MYYCPGNVFIQIVNYRKIEKKAIWEEQLIQTILTMSNGYLM